MCLVSQKQIEKIMETEVNGREERLVTEMGVFRFGSESQVGS